MRRGARSLNRSGRYRYCANAQHGVCNWLVPADQPEIFCAACRHNRTIPDLSVPDNARTGERSKVAKHRLFYTLLRLRLPLDNQNRESGWARVRLHCRPDRRAATCR